jgi:uncharacterized damage-inducible protein DinB
MSVDVSKSLDVRYPVGKFARPEVVSKDDLAKAIAVLAELPGQLRSAVEGLSAEQLDTPYREGGWTVRQVVHHVAESHAHAFLRTRLALTEDWPTIKPYSEKACAELEDSRTAPVEWSLGIVDGVHGRWVATLRSLNEEQWERGIEHPENGRLTVDVLTMLYGWHSRHHLAHVTELRKRKGW